MSYVLRSRTIARLLIGAATAATISMSSTAMADLLIDDFSKVGSPMPWPIILNNGGSMTVSESGLGTNVLGGTRRTTLTAQGSGTVAAVAGVGFFDYASNTNSSGQVQLEYNGGGSSQGLNLNHSNFASLHIELAMYSPFTSPLMPVSVTLDDGSTLSVLTQSISTSGAQIISFAFENFSGLGSMDNISTIKVQFDAGAGTDFRIDRIYAVVPGPGVLAAFGLAGLATNRRRRRHS